jgi:hypothetical protein
MRTKLFQLILVCLFFIAVPVHSANRSSGLDPGLSPDISPPLQPLIAPLIEPLPKPLPETGGSESEAGAIDWQGVFRQSMYFLTIEHTFRLATEEGTRNAKGPFLRGYADSVRNLHGWSDGDPFYVNYVGHPMQGAAAGYLWVQNDRRYTTAEFGRSSHYWKSRLRAAAFAFVYSSQFEIGPLSEANIGYIQSRYPQQGFVDHVITPTFGFAWMVAEDSIDRYLLTAFERRVGNPQLRLLARGFLNPSRSMANMLRWKLPWHRDTRPGVLARNSASFERAGIRPNETEEAELPPDVGPAPFEFTAAAKQQTFIGPGSRGSCTGGGGEAAFRLSNQWQLIVDVNGCELRGLNQNTSGDSLTYLVGPRWVAKDRRLRPYMQFLVGGTKLTHETVSVETKRLLEAAAEEKGLKPPARDEFAISDQTHGFALSAGTGLDFKLNRAAAIKIAGLEYTRAWNKPLDGSDYNTGLQLKIGVTLRMGTW